MDDIARIWFQVNLETTEQTKLGYMTLDEIATTLDSYNFEFISLCGRKAVVDSVTGILELVQ